MKNKFQLPEEIAAEETRYLDSLQNFKVEVDGKLDENRQPLKEKIKVFDILIADYTYKEVKERSMNLGLDLKGGISIILHISIDDIL